MRVFIHVFECIFTQVIEQELRHEISRFGVKGFRRLMEVKEEATRKTNGGTHARQEKEKLVHCGRMAGGVSSISLKQEQGSCDEHSPYAFFIFLFALRKGACKITSELVH